MSHGILAVCIGLNLLSPLNKELLLLEATLEVAEKVCCLVQPSAAFPAYENLAVQRSLDVSSLEQVQVGWLPGRAAPQPSGQAQEWERLLGPFSGSWVETKGLVCAGECAGGVHDGELRGTLWGGDN